MKKIFCVIVALAVALIAKADRILSINSESDLRAFATSVNSGDNYSGAIVTLNADISLTAPIEPATSNWTPISSFAGTFDGQGHIISDLFVNTDQELAGFFGVIANGATVKDVHIRHSGDAYISSTSVATRYVGSIAGRNAGTIVGCSNSIKVSGSNTGDRVGGIVGENASGGVVQNCYNLGTVYNGASTYLGGVVGNNAGSVKNCFMRVEVRTGQDVKRYPICVNNSGTVSGCFYVGGAESDAIGEIRVCVLNNSADNTAAISAAAKAGAGQNILLKDRIIYSDGAWNTLCLPFDIPASGNGRSPIAGASVKEVNTTTSGYDSSTERLVLNFTDATSITAGKPYIVKWDRVIAEDLSNPVFLNVTVNSADPTPVEAANVRFIGSYSPVAITGGDQSTLYLGAENNLYYPTANRTIGSCRAYFRLTGSTSVKSCVLNFDDDETTDMQPIQIFKSKVQNEVDAVYTLDGRRIPMPSVYTKGVYIVNGKKMVVK